MLVCVAVGNLAYQCSKVFFGKVKCVAISCEFRGP